MFPNSVDFQSSGPGSNAEGQYWANVNVLDSNFQVPGGSIVKLIKNTMLISLVIKPDWIETLRIDEFS